MTEEGTTGRWVGIVSVERVPCSRSSARMRCLRFTNGQSYFRICSGHALSSNPTPELERLFADTPTSGKIAKLAYVSIMVRKSKGVLIIIQVKFGYLGGKASGRFLDRKCVGMDLDIDTIGQYFCFCPALCSRR